MQSITLDVDAFSQRKSSMVYPNFELSEINDTLPVVVQSLEKGEVPLLAHHQGQCRIVMKISLAAANVSKLIRTQGMLIYNADEQHSSELYSVRDYLEVV